MKRCISRWLGGMLCGLLAAGGHAATPLGLELEPLNSAGRAQYASAAIDAQGQATAVWLQATETSSAMGHIWASTHRRGHSWSSHSVLSRLRSPMEALPLVRVSAAGDAIAVWTQTDGIWTAERPSRGAWGAARLLVAGAQWPLFAMNAQGDAVLAWLSHRYGPTYAARQLNVMRRDAGRPWQPAQAIVRASTSAYYVSADDLAIADGTGEVVATWQKFEVHCGPGCQHFNFVLHASRAARGSGDWADSGPLYGPGTGTRAWATVDPAGHAALAFVAQGVMVSLQPGPGAAWSEPSVVHRGYATLAGLASDADGKATLAFADAGAKVMIGDLATGEWAEPVVVSGSDMHVGSVMLATSSINGAAILTWRVSDELYHVLAVRAAVRCSTFSAWGAARTLSPPDVQNPLPEAAAIDRSGRAIAIFGAEDSAFTMRTEYAATN